MSVLRCVVDIRTEVGEGPVWDDRAQVLWWVDVKARTLFRFDPASGENRAWPMPKSIGCVVPRAQGGLIGAFQTGFKAIDPDTGAVTPIADPEPDQPGNRFNDGKCDRRGRPFAGTLYRLDADRSIHVMRREVYVSNGLDWSLDDRLMYYTDSLRRLIWVYDYDPAAGTMAGERVFARIPEDAGVPDGLCVDADGFVWGAHWGGWRVTRYAPDGSIERVLEMPVPQPSSCTFGGPDLTTLYVTSAALNMTAEDLAKATQGGGLFAIEVGVRGQRACRFAG